MSAWQIDSSKLRQTLDELRAGLSRPRRTTTSESVAVVARVDMEQLTASLRELLAAFETKKLDRQLAVVSVAAEYRDPALHRRLDSTLRDLGKATEQRILNILGKLKSQSAKRLLGQSVPDFLSVVSKVHDENAHSDVLRWFLSPVTAPTIAPAALAALTSKLPSGAEWTERVQSAVACGTLSVRREYTFGREWAGTAALERIDLFLSGPGFAIAIENKLWSSEHTEQTTTYWDWLSQLRGLRAGFFLTPTGVAAQSPHFQPLSYTDMLCCLLEGANGRLTEAEELMLASYLKALRASALRIELQIVGEAIHEQPK